MNIHSVKAKYEEQLMGLPNVNGVGIGEKLGKEVIKVFVTSKVTLRPLATPFSSQAPTTVASTRQTASRH